MTLPRHLFLAGFVGVVVVSLIAFTFTIGDGRLSAPGICLALSTGVLVWVGRTLFQSAQALVASGSDAEAVEEKAASGRRRKELEREYYTLKRALKELELDYTMGKVSPDDYAEIRSRYRERAVRVLRQLDQGESYKAQIEADLEARRAARPAQPVAPPVAAGAALAAVEDTPSSAPEAKDAVVAAAQVEGSCSKCQTHNDSDAVFCKKCGHRLLAA